MEDKKGFELPALIASIIFAIIWAIVAANVSDNKAVNAARDAGYTDIKVEDSTIMFVEFRGCGESDDKRWTVTGTNARGEKRTFFVCGGPLKGGTVRSK
jgi:hypothetical protein